MVGRTDTAPQFDQYRRVSDYITLDLQLSYEFRKPNGASAAPALVDPISPVPASEASASFLQRLLWGTKITVGANNVFDRNPPTVLGALNDTYDTSLYSIRNRY